MIVSEIGTRLPRPFGLSETAERGRGLLELKVLLCLLSVIAGSVDAISFIGLDGLFTAHITGNLVILAARFAAGNQTPLAHLISVPVFVAALAATRLLAGGLDRWKIGTLRPLLLLQFALLCAFLAICISTGSQADPDAPIMIFAAMLGVCAMAVQNAFVQISLAGVPSTTVMTTNVTRFAMDLGDMLLGKSRNDGKILGERARLTGLAIAGFLVGCGLGAWCQTLVGLSSLALPTGVGLVAIAVAFAVERDSAPAPRPAVRRQSDDLPRPIASPATSLRDAVAAALSRRRSLGDRAAKPSRDSAQEDLLP
jgi:uncharacterized membrane protein YoaK (UPF0700 family)